MPKWKEKKKVSPPPDPAIPVGYEKYVAKDENEANDLAVEANAQAGIKEPTVKHLSHIVIKDGSESGRPEHTFLKKIVKNTTLAIAILLLCSSNVFATRSDANFDETRDFDVRRTDIALTEIYARTRAGAMIRPVSTLRQDGTGDLPAVLILATADYYFVTGDTTITSITIDSTWVGRLVRFARPFGSTTAVTFQDGGVNVINNITENLLLEGDQNLSAGDTLSLLAFDDNYWYQIASSDN